jgi:hypothetical protein
MIKHKLDVTMEPKEGVLQSVVDTAVVQGAHLYKIVQSAPSGTAYHQRLQNYYNMRDHIDHMMEHLVNETHWMRVENVFGVVHDALGL